MAVMLKHEEESASKEESSMTNSEPNACDTLRLSHTNNGFGNIHSAFSL